MTICPTLRQFNIKICLLGKSNDLITFLTGIQLPYAAFFDLILGKHFKNSTPENYQLQLN